MNRLDVLKKDIADYWSTRASTYVEDGHERNRPLWQQDFVKHISAHYPERRPEEIRVLDLATGSGFMTGIAAEAGYSVTAIDLAAGMLEESKRRNAGYADRITYYQMNAEELQFEENTFDVVFSRWLSWVLPRPEKAYQEWLRVLKPGGLLMTYDGTWNRRFYDSSARDEYERLMRENRKQNTKSESGFSEEMKNRMDAITVKLTASYLVRPMWDLCILDVLGADVEEDMAFANGLGQKEGQGGSQFLVKAVKRE